jgi:hypothetical protein
MDFSTKCRTYVQRKLLSYTQCSYPAKFNTRTSLTCYKPVPHVHSPAFPKTDENTTYTMNIKLHHTPLN